MNTRTLLFCLGLLIIAPLHAKTILVVGDSLSAAYGIEQDKGWVALMSHDLAKYGSYRVINISTSGDTTSNGLSKLPAAITQYKPAVVIIELGANDGLRGLPLNHTKKNLATMIKLSLDHKAQVLLLASWLPPNYGPRFLQQFASIYDELAKMYKVPMIPMFLAGIAGRDHLMQKDGLHPNAQAQPLILKNVWPDLKKLLQLDNSANL